MDSADICDTHMKICAMTGLHELVALARRMWNRKEGILLYAITEQDCRQEGRKEITSKP